MSVLLLVALLTATPDAQVQTVAGDSIVGQVTALTEDMLTVITADGDRTIPVKELVGITVGAPAPAIAPGTTAWIKLVDGSRISATAYAVTGRGANVMLVGGGELEIPTRLIDSVEFREHTGPAAVQWDEITTKDRSEDLIVVRKDDALDFLSGVLHDISADVVQFELDGETRRVKRPRVDGLLYRDQNRPRSAPARGILTDTAGMQWQSASLTLDGDNIRLRTPAGLEVTRPAANLARIDFSQGNLQYLGDLKPESINWTPYFGDANVSPASRVFYQPRIDRSLDGGPLQLDGKEYAKGIAAHSRTELTYRLPDKYRSFHAIVGIDDRVRPGGNVHLQILGDDRTLFEGTLTGKDAPRPVDLDISGVNRLKLVIDFGDDLDVGDALDLCEARILK